MAQYPIVARQGGSQSTLNVTAKTVIKLTPGTVWSVIMNTANSVAGGVYDASTTAGSTAANLIKAIPTATNGEIMNGPFPCAVGILVDPGTGGVASVSFN